MDNFDIYQMMQEESGAVGEILELPSSVLGDMEGDGEILPTNLQFEDRSDLRIRIEEELINDVQLLEEPAFFFFKDGYQLLQFCTTALVVISFCIYVFKTLYKKKRQKNKNVIVDRPWTSKEFQLFMTAGGCSCHAGGLFGLNIWQDDASALKIMSRVAQATRAAAVALTMTTLGSGADQGKSSEYNDRNSDLSINSDTKNNRQALKYAIIAARKLFRIIFEDRREEDIHLDGEDNDDDEGSFSSSLLQLSPASALQGVVPGNVDEELFQVSCLLLSARNRLVVRLAEEICQDFQTTERTILDNLSTAVSLENVRHAGREGGKEERRDGNHVRTSRDCLAIHG